VKRPATFRVFVSSTFKDLGAERNVLQEEVFPRLRELCLAHGARFQPIDLRWGVSEEASLDQQAMNICLAEIERCRDVTPRPNFIVLLGNRYGWLAPPPQIPVAEFERIRGRVLAEDDRALLEAWYARDDNATPLEYYLRARQGTLGQFQDPARWEEVEKRLGAILRAAAGELDLPETDRRRYSASATEQEIMAGALNTGDPQGHAFAFIRELAGDYPDPAQAAEGEPVLDFADPDQAPLDRLKDRLGSELPVKRYAVQWDAQSRRPATGHLEDLAHDVKEALETAILGELQRPTPLPGRTEQPAHIEAHPALDAEGRAHWDFANERARIFVGREEALAAIARYLAGPGSRPLVITGEGGSGKSALLAEALRRAQHDQPAAAVIYRFIGATPDSSQGATLLRGLCEEVARRAGPGVKAVPTGYPELVTDFRERLASAGANRPLIVFIDSLDQLPASQGARGLAWLPTPLPEGVRLVVSTRAEDTLETLVRRGAQVEELGPMPSADGRALLRRWLMEAHRRLQPAQEQEVLAKFQASNSNPLYLRLAFEQARRWRSEDPPEELTVGVEGIIRDNTFGGLARQDNHGTVLVSHALGYLAASRYGLTEDELLDLLSRDPEVYEWFLRGARHTPLDLRKQAREYVGDGESATAWLDAIRKDKDLQPELRRFLDQVLARLDGPRLPVILWSRLAFDLRPYLTELGAEEAVLIGFFHRELADVAGDLYLGGGRAARYHGKLADYFRPPPGEDGRPGWAGASLHALGELPYHLAQAGEDRWGELEDTLTDFGFLETKVSRVGVQRDKDGKVTAYAGVYLLQDDFDLGLREVSGGDAAGRPRIIVTATDFGDGLVIRCPYCNTVREFQQDWLGDDHLTCPNDACKGPLKVNPFVVGGGLCSSPRRCAPGAVRYVTGTISALSRRPPLMSRRPTVPRGWRRRSVGEPGLKIRSPSAA
jgi:hypothetical protein